MFVIHTAVKGYSAAPMTVCLNDLKITDIAAKSDSASCRRFRKSHLRNVIQLIQETQTVRILWSADLL